MAVCFAPFFAVKPPCAVLWGAFAGTNVRRRWLLPPLTAGLCRTGAWLFSSAAEPAFLVYAAYLLIGATPTLIAVALQRGRHRDRERTDA